MFQRRFRYAMLIAAMLTAASDCWNKTYSTAVAGAEDDTAPAETALPLPAFQPGEISIGVPLQLPAASDLQSVDSGLARSAPQKPPAVPAASSAPAVRSGAPSGASGWLGMSVDDSITTGRLVIVEVAKDSPALRAGIKPQDFLLAIDGTALQTADQLAAALAAIVPGNEVKVAVGRADRIDEYAMTATARPSREVARAWQAAAGVRPASRDVTQPNVPAVSQPAASFEQNRLPPQTSAPKNVPTAAPAAPSLLTSSIPPSGSIPKGRTALGVRTLPIDTIVQARFHLSEPAGALIIGVVHDLPASKAGIPAGSVIVALDHQPVRSPNELTRLVTRAPIHKPVTLEYVLPGGEARQAEVSLQPLEIPLERALAGPDPIAAQLPNAVPSDFQQP